MYNYIHTYIHTYIYIYIYMYVMIYIYIYDIIMHIVGGSGVVIPPPVLYPPGIRGHTPMLQAQTPRPCVDDRRR